MKGLMQPFELSSFVYTRILFRQSLDRYRTKLLYAIHFSSPMIICLRSGLISLQFANAFCISKSSFRTQLWADDLKLFHFETISRFWAIVSVKLRLWDMQNISPLLAILPVIISSKISIPHLLAKVGIKPRIHIYLLE